MREVSRRKSTQFPWIDQGNHPLFAVEALKSLPAGVGEARLFVFVGGLAIRQCLCASRHHRGVTVHSLQEERVLYEGQLWVQ